MNVGILFDKFFDKSRRPERTLVQAIARIRPRSRLDKPGEDLVMGGLTVIVKKADHVIIPSRFDRFIITKIALLVNIIHEE